MNVLDHPILLAQQAKPAGDAQSAGKPADSKEKANDQGNDKKQDDSPAAKMARRWPQPARVGFLVGLPMLDDNDRTLGFVTQVVEGPDGAIKLIVAYNRTFGWFGWFTRPVAVPIEKVAIFGRQIGSIDMEPPEYKAAPTWMAGQDTPLSDDDHVKIALMRR